MQDRFKEAALKLLRSEAGDALVDAWGNENMLAFLPECTISNLGRLSGRGVLVFYLERTAPSLLGVMTCLAADAVRYQDADITFEWRCDMRADSLTETGLQVAFSGKFTGALNKVIDKI
jgi:hypothetical protein